MKLYGRLFLFLGAQKTGTDSIIKAQKYWF
jgi:hypothetical protein